MPQLRLLFVIDDDSYFCSHRLDLARAARTAGYEVLIATHVQNHGKQIEQEGFKLFPLRFRRGIQNPFHEFATVAELVRLYRRERPDIVHHVSLKLVAYGSMAARMTGVPAVVNAFTGLGYTFTANTHKAKMVRLVLTMILRVGLAHPRNVTIFQNDNDYEDLVHIGLMAKSRAVVIRGAGVNVSQFTPDTEPKGEPVVMLASRMLWDKGVGEFVESARLLKEQGVKARCVLVGSVDPESSTRISMTQLQSWKNEGHVEWWGHEPNMECVYRKAHVFVLPTYYGEGLPKVLLEAAACGKPLVATDWRGCREIVQDGENGLLVPVKNAYALAGAIRKLVEDRPLRLQMGVRGRAIVVQDFASERIAEQTLAVYARLERDLMS